jgi:tRNA(Arg) A34 adenosine deaminase TadA
MCLGAILLCQFRRVVVALASPTTGGLALIAGKADYAARCPSMTLDLAADESRAQLRRYREQNPSLDPQRESMLAGLLGPR